MLHIRDCPGTTSTFDVCPFPWCRKVKHLLYHLVACPRPRDCAICSPIALSPNWQFIVGLTNHRREKQRERAKAALAATAAAKAKAPPPKVACTTKNAKPVLYRPPVKKPTLTNKPYKPAIAKPTPPAPAARVSLITRPATNTGPGRAPPTTKPTNGVVVKSLVKPVGRSSVVVVKARPHRPVISGATSTATALSGTKPTVVPLPGVDDAASHQKCVSSVVVSTINSDVTPATPALVPVSVKSDNNDSFQGSSLPTETEESATDGSFSAACSSDNAHQCPTAELGNAEEVPTAMEIEPHSEGTHDSIAISVASGESTQAALRSSVHVDSQVVATAAAVAASMNTDEPHPGEERAVDATSLKTNDSVAGGYLDDNGQRKEPGITDAEMPNMTQAHTNTASVCAVSERSTTCNSVEVIASVDTTKRDPDSKALPSVMPSSIVTPPTSSTANKPANPTPFTIQRPLSEASQTQTKLGANMDVVAIDGAPLRSMAS
jgi:hypothetical protein